ncbi:MAG: acyl carrier protein [Pseudomonadota bacterium]
MRDTIRGVFEELWAEQEDGPPPVLSDDTVLLESGLDSLGLAIFVSRLDEELGFDPFTASDEAYYPRTFGEFVAFYEKNAQG